MENSKKSFISGVKSVFIVLLCAVLISMPIIDTYRAHAIAGVDDAALCSVGIAICSGLLIGASIELASALVTDPYIQQKTYEFGEMVVDGSKNAFRMTVGALKRAKAYLFDRLNIKHDIPTSAPTTPEPVTPPNIFEFNTVEYPASKITYGNDGKTVTGIAYDASFLTDHVLWETGQQSTSIDSRNDSYFSSLQEGFYFTGTSTISGFEYNSNIIWTLGDLRYSMSTTGNNYSHTVAWHVYEPLYFVNQGTGNRELLLCAAMTGSALGGTKFLYATNPSLDTALNAAASTWYDGNTTPPLRAYFGSFSPSVYKTYSQTALNYREYSYEVWNGNAVEPTTIYEPTSEPSISGGRYDADYDITQKVKDDNTYVNIPITPEIQTVAEAVAAGTAYNDLTPEQKRSLRELSKSVYGTTTVGGTTTTTEAVTDNTGAVVTPAVTTVTGSIPLNDYIDSTVTETGQYQGILSRIAGTLQSTLDTVKSIPQTITETGQGIIDAVDYQINPNSPQFPDPFISFFTGAIGSAFPSVSLFQQAFNRFTAADSPLVLEYDIVLGSRQYHFSVDFSWFEAHRARFRSGVGVMFWLLAWLGVIRGFLSIFHIGLGKVGAGIAIGNTGAGGSSGASSLDVGSGSVPIDSTEYAIWKREGRL